MAMPEMPKAITVVALVALVVLAGCGSGGGSPTETDTAPAATEQAAEATGVPIPNGLCADWAEAVDLVDREAVEYGSRGLHDTPVERTGNCTIEPDERPEAVPEGSDFVILRVRVSNLDDPNYQDLGNDVPDLIDPPSANDWQSHRYDEYDEPSRGTRSCWGEDDATSCKDEVGVDGRLYASFFKADYGNAQFDVEILYLTGDESDAMAQTVDDWSVEAWAAIAETVLSSFG